MEKYAGNRGAAADRGFWLKAFDGGAYSIDRISRGETWIQNLSVALIGGIQPKLLAEMEGLTSDGLLQRFLPVMLQPAPLALDRPGNDEEYDKLVRKLIFARPERIILGDNALEVMHALRQELHDIETASMGLASGFQSFVGKLPGYAGRLALILHMASHPDHGQTYAISESTVENVRKLVLEFFVPHAVAFYQAAEGNAEADRLRAIASWILTSGKTRIRAADLTGKVRSLRGLSVFDINRRLSPLVAGGWLDPDEPGPGCRLWTVNPGVFPLFEERRTREGDRKQRLRKVMAKSFTRRPRQGV
jgi:hypothetical protein